MMAVKRLQDHVELQTEILEVMRPQIAAIHAAIVPTEPRHADHQLETLLTELVAIGRTHTVMLHRIEALLRRDRNL